MAQQMDRTCWRGLQVDCPAQWEVIIASGPDEARRVAFADRTYRRLDLQWKPINYTPDLDDMLQRHRTGAGRKQDLSNADELPEPWKGLLRKTEHGTILHAGRFFKDEQILLEATIVWPSRRNTALERAILSSVEMQDSAATGRLWQAMGNSITLGREFDLMTSTAHVGRVRWDFAVGTGRKARELTLERLAMPDTWLDRPLEAWLAKELPDECRVQSTQEIKYGPHEARQLISEWRHGRLGSLVGPRRLRIDIGWTCPSEGRLYHVWFTELCPKRQIALPADVQVHCCRPVPVILRDEE